MKQTPKLSWNRISTWQAFEDLSVRIANNKFPGQLYEKYLKQGHNQSGIDILSFDFKSGSHCCIQCKHAQSLSLAELRSAITNFEENKFVGSASLFILATTADLQETKRKEYIENEKIRFREQYEIQLEVWDVGALELILEQHYRVVAYYFGQDDAERICQKRTVLRSSLKPNPDYISRRISRCQNEEVRDPWNTDKEPSFKSFATVIEPTLIDTHRICLIGDAYEGKSQMLHQSAVELSAIDLNLFPILLEVKEMAIKPITDALDIQGQWKEIPERDLIVIIDGLDEVATDRFMEVVKHIKDFVTSYPGVSILFSCRRIFYHRYALRDQLPDFEFFELQPLSLYDVDQYLKDKLKNKKDRFENQIQTLGIGEFLHQPFYLVTLVQSYKKSPTNLPTSKREIVERFVDESLDKSALREIKSGVLLKEKKTAYRKAIQKFAMALQLAGLNSFEENDFEIVFDSDESELLKHSSIVSTTDRHWSFTNAIFQEQLAALEMANYPIEEINSVISVGTSLRKVRTKWIQTVASLLELLKPSDPIRASLLKLIADDNIELVTLSDGSKFDTEFRNRVLESIIQRCVVLNVRPILVREEQIAAFVGNDSRAKSQLISKLAEDIPFVAQITCLRVLKHLVLLPSELPLMYSVGLKVLDKTDSSFCGRLVLELLSKQPTDTAQLLPIAFGKGELLNEHDFRQGIYSYLIDKGLVEDYYDFGLAGFEVLKRYNDSISHHGSEAMLETFLLKAKSYKNIRKLLTLIVGDVWLGFYRHRNDSLSLFLSHLCRITAKIYPEHPLIISPMLKVMVAVSQRHYANKYDPVVDFFELTNTKRLALEIAILNIETPYEWAFTGLIDKNSMDVLFYAHEDGYLSKDNLRRLNFYLDSKGHTETASMLREHYANILGPFYPPVDPAKLTVTQIRELRLGNDITAIQSEQHLKNAVINIFGAFNNPVINKEDLWRFDDDNDDVRIEADSFVVSSFLREELDGENSLALEAALQALERIHDFNALVARYLYRYPFEGNDNESSLKTWLEKYYVEKIAETDFTNTYWDSPGYVHGHTLQVFLGKVFLKFEFPTTKLQLINLIWLDREGINGVDHNITNRRYSINRKVLEHLEDDTQLLEEKIIENLKTPISCRAVLASHFDLCRKLKLEEAREFVIDAIENAKIDQYDVRKATDIYLELGGAVADLIPYFQSLKDPDYTFYHFVEIIRHEYPEEVHNPLKDCLSNPAVSADYKLLAAQHLAQLGQKEGLEYIVHLIERNGKAPYSIQGNFRAWNVETEIALALLKPYAKHLLDKESESGRFHDTLKSFVSEMLFGFAAKSEKELGMVESFLEEARQDLATTYPDADRINWYTLQILEKFRDVQQAEWTAVSIRNRITTLRTFVDV